MRRKILTVTDVFKISGKGLVLTEVFYPGSVISSKPKVGDEIIVVRPNGEKLNSSVKGLEISGIINGVPGSKILAILVGDLKKEDVPIGSEVFIEE